MSLSVALILLTSPLWLLAALAIKLDSRGPVLFSQVRVGHRGRYFRIHKFRSMVQNAETETGPVLSPLGDNRVTRVGRLLRRSRADELPQLWNILRGDMSFVGPRPERPEFFDQFVRENPLYERRTLVQPGLTGSAQIHAYYGTDYRHKLRYDLMYINNLSFALDLRLIVATIRIVLTGRGAA
jgi:lipopolysaccharide/colanic/teichoic acid biosynthesis glycosyltransferase